MKIILSPYHITTILLLYSHQPQLNMIRPHAELVNLTVADIIKRACLIRSQRLLSKACTPKPLLFQNTATA